MTRRLRVSLIAGLGVILAACGSSSQAMPFAHAFPTKEAAATAVTEAIWQRNVPLLESIAVTEPEFRRNVWPRLPASQPDVNMPADYLWNDTHTKSLGDLAQALAEYGGQRLNVQEVAFGGAPTDYGAFAVHPKTQLRVNDETGTVKDVRLFGSMIETPDGWKIYSYIVD